MGNLTKSNYEKIAEIIKEHIEIMRTKGINPMFSISEARHLADYFQSKDKNFKREEFLKLCGVKE